MKNSFFFGKYSLLVFFVSVFFFLSCQKEHAEPKEPTKKELLINTWVVSDVLEPGGSSVINLPVPQIICLKDNIFELLSNDTYIIDEGAVVCDPTTAGSGDWALVENETVLKFTPAVGDQLSFNLVEVNATTLKLSYELTGTLAGIYTIILKKQ